ncbi:MAG TPA: hypothetical protein DEP66_03905, partial [Acidimicrobiaceae bacterium]|nr:hypothetical protein [Acidimicrobiaceae bacterium]
ASGTAPAGPGTAPAGPGGTGTAVASRPVDAVTGRKLGRNDPCHCGSGRKLKHCHGA